MADDESTADPRAFKQLTTAVPPPAKMSLNGSLAQNWRRCRRQFDNYATASRLTKEIDWSYKCADFLDVMSEDACEISDSLEFDSETEKNDLEKVKQKLVYFFLGKHTSLCVLRILSVQTGRP